MNKDAPKTSDPPDTAYKLALKNFRVEKGKKFNQMVLLNYLNHKLE